MNDLQKQDLETELGYDGRRRLLVLIDHFYYLYENKKNVSPRQKKPSRTYMKR